MGNQFLAEQLGNLTRNFELVHHVLDLLPQGRQLGAPEGIEEIGMGA